LLKIFIFFLTIPNILFGGFADDLENNPREQNRRFYEKVHKQIAENHSIIKDLTTRNLKCLEGTQKMLENMECYSIYLSIQDVLKENSYSKKEKVELISTLAKRCPKWKDYEIEDCK
jgi:hypothetical protein